MKKGIIMLRCWVVFLSLLLVFPAGTLSAATSAANIKHTPPGKIYIPGFRINVEAQVNDQEGILTTRCYFKTKNDKNFAFVQMTNNGKENYQAILPAPFVGSDAVEYLFMSVSKEKKVTRTEVFVLEEGKTKEGIKWKDINDIKEVRLDQIQDTAEKFALLYDNAKGSYINDLPSYQTASKSGSLQIGTEIPKKMVPLNGFYDTVTIAEVPAMAKYGLAAEGLYSSEAVSAGGGASASGATSAATATSLSTGTLVVGGIAALAVVAGGVALSGGGSSGGGGAAAGGLTSADLVATWRITSTSLWHSNTPYVLTNTGTWSGIASSLSGPQPVNGTWSFNAANQTLTLSESSAGYSATINAGAISGNSSSFSVVGVLPLIPYTNNNSVSFASQAPDTFTFTRQ